MVVHLLLLKFSMGWYNDLWMSYFFTKIKFLWRYTYRRSGSQLAWYIGVTPSKLSWDAKHISFERWFSLSFFLALQTLITIHKRATNVKILKRRELPLSANFERKFQEEINFFEWAIPSPFSFIFTTNLCENIHPLYGAGIRTHDQQVPPITNRPGQEQIY